MRVRRGPIVKLIYLYKALRRLRLWCYAVFQRRYYRSPPLKMLMAYARVGTFSRINSPPGGGGGVAVEEARMCGVGSIGTIVKRSDEIDEICVTPIDWAKIEVTMQISVKNCV